MPSIIAGNWKMNGGRADIAPYISALLAAPLHASIVICPPFPYLGEFATRLAGSPIQLGGQDCHANEAGAHTGDVSAGMVKDLGATHVILGHSERRADHFETNAVVRGKAEAALSAGLTPIICVGETDSEREAGEAEDVVASQLSHSLPDGFDGLVAYEPVWAIGTGKTPTEADITAMHRAIRAKLVALFPQNGSQTAILYGGSVKPSNAKAILALPEVGGALVGGASLKAEDFLAIAAAAPDV